MVIDFLYRIYAGFIRPPLAEKEDNVLRVGLLGASNIAYNRTFAIPVLTSPWAVILPARSHPEVIVAAVAARDRKKAEAYAKKHDIPVVHSSYQELLDDPAISCVYIALPNSLHYEWALRSLRAGKHVLLEKPSCSNAAEARTLFNHPLVTAANAPVLLEAFHYRFHPAWQTYLSQIHNHPAAGPIKHAYCQQYVWKGLFSADDIRFKYALSGGCLMDIGTYGVSCLRQILQSELEVVNTTYRKMSPPTRIDEEAEEQIDQAITVTYQTAEGAIGTLVADLAHTGGWPSFLPSSWTQAWPSAGWPKCVVELGDKEIEPELSGSTGEIHSVQRMVALWNFLAPSLYHRIDVRDNHTIRQDGIVVKTWTEMKYIKTYSYPDQGNHTGAEWWSTYRHQLEEFVNKVKGRKECREWVDGADSIAQMETIDRTYAKAGLKPRPQSEFSL